MLKKAKVVNIHFEDAFKKTLQTRSSELSEGFNPQPELNLETFLKSRMSTTQTYELLSIIKNEPVNLTQLLNKKQENLSFLNRKDNNNLEIYELQPILPQVETQNEQKSSNKSIDVDISRANSTFANQPSFSDQINEDNTETGFKNSFQIKSNFVNAFENSSSTSQVIGQTQSDQYFYLIPEKYNNNLELILTHFLNYKMMYIPGKQNLSKTLNVQKRPKTTTTALNNLKTKESYSEAKPFTAISRNRKSNQKTFFKEDNFTQDFNDHLQKMMQMEKQIQKKSKRIIFLESQLTACYQTIRQKNNEIKQLNQKQSLIKKKFKYQMQRLMKGKIMTDINEIFLNSLHEQNNHGQSIFEINGKKFVKTEDIQTISQNAFLTSPKSFTMAKSSEKQNMNKTESFDKIQCQYLSRSQIAGKFITTKNKAGNKKLEILKVTKLVDLLNKQITKYEAQRQILLDSLAQNHAKVQRNIEQIQATIKLKRIQIEKYADELSMLKNSTL